MANVASYFLQIRPAVLGAVTLFALAMTPHDRMTPIAKRTIEVEAGGRSTALMLERGQVLQEPIIIDLPVIRPAPHPDGRPWPLGMVITPPPTHDPIVLWDGSPLDTLLSLLTAPFRVLAT